MGDFTYACIAICVIVVIVLGVVTFASLITSAFFFAAKAIIAVLTL